MKQKGFTLIELIIVIVVLSILAMTAASKFINLQRDSRISALQGLKGEMTGAMNQLHPKTILAGVDTQASGSITILGDNIHIVYGYPKADAAKSWNKLMNQVFVDSQYYDNIPSEWYFHNDTSKPYITFMHRSKKYSTDKCHIKYSEAVNRSAIPEFELIDTGC